MPTARQVLEKATERDAIITKADIMRDAYRMSITSGSTIDAERVWRRAEGQAVQVEKLDGERSRQEKYTTKDLMKAERDVLNIARERQHETQHGIHLKDVTAACRWTEEVKD